MKPWLKLAFVSAIILTAHASYAQEPITLEGRVYSENMDVSATHVLNTTSKKATITTVDGFFDIVVRLNDTLVFSAVQFKRKEVVVTPSVLESKLLIVPLQEVLTQLEEVVVTPYNLTGDMGRDLDRVPVTSVITSHSLGLLNKKARLKPKGMGATLRLNKYLNLVTGYDTLALRPDIRLDLKIVRLADDISGRTKDLEKYKTLEKELDQIEAIRLFFTDFVFVSTLKIPEAHINDFLNYCMVDKGFKEGAKADDMASVYGLMEAKAPGYRKNNGLE
ncbi:hypothetical protein [Zobellia uliginosa]|uniref:hypothetical protein n=1 Tax=Zobellia uliginosa TaxID=143224 RepID=UPI0026E3623C|nr:hypothetical protein [Zobellia uliginosa]MDO6519234.1 hypothetical protein [Zobellia uliginosa]